MIHKARQALLQIVTHTRGMIKHLITLVNLQHLVRNSAAQRVATVCITVTKDAHIRRRTLDGFSKVSANNSRADGHISRAQRLSKHHHLRLHSHCISAEILTQAAKSTNNLVIPQGDTVLVQDRLNRRVITRRRDQHTAGTGHWFGDHCRNSLGPRFQDLCLQLLSTSRHKIGLAFARRC